MTLLKQKSSKFALILNVAILGSLVPQSIATNAAVNIKKLASVAANKNINIYKTNKSAAEKEHTAVPGKLESPVSKEQKKVPDEFEQAVKETKKFLCSENCLEKGIDNPQYAKTVKVVGEQIEERLNNGKYGEENNWLASRFSS